MFKLKEVSLTQPGNKSRQEVRDKKKKKENLVKYNAD